MKFKVNLKELLDKKGMSQNQLAKVSNTPVTTVRRYYQDTAKSFNSQVLAKFCVALDCSIEELLVEIK